VLASKIPASLIEEAHTILRRAASGPLDLSDSFLEPIANQMVLSRLLIKNDNLMFELPGAGMTKQERGTT